MKEKKYDNVERRKEKKKGMKKKAGKMLGRIDFSNMKAVTRQKRKRT